MEERDNQNIIAQYMEKDAEVLKENGVAPKQQNQEQGSFKNGYWKFVGWFFGVLVLGFIGLAVAGLYAQKQEKAVQEQSAADYMRITTELQDRLRNDKDGGATPEETLQLFTDALKKGDIEQADKYFVFEPEKQQQRLMNAVKTIRDKGKMNQAINLLGKAKYDASMSSDNDVWFQYLNNNKAEIAIEITRSKYSTIWKIEYLGM